MIQKKSGFFKKTTNNIGFLINRNNKSFFFKQKYLNYIRVYVKFINTIFDLTYGRDLYTIKKSHNRNLIIKKYQAKFLNDFLSNKLTL